jgi:hypothetical protein
MSANNASRSAANSESIISAQSATAAVSKPASSASNNSSNEKLIRVRKDKNGTFTATIVDPTNLASQSSSIPFTGVSTPNPSNRTPLKIDPMDGGRRKRSHRKRTHRKRSHRRR